MANHPFSSLKFSVSERRQHMNLSLIFDILKLAGMYVLLSLGFVIIYRASRVLNLAQPGLILLAAFLALKYLPQNFDTPITLPKILMVTGILMLGGAVLGILSFRFLIQPLSGSSRISIVLMTLAVLFLLESVADIVWPGVTGFMGAPGSNISYQINNSTSIRLFDLIPPIVGAIVWILLIVFYRVSRQGKRVRAVAENASLAARRGININHIGALSWAFAVIVAVIAGVTLGTQGVVSSLIVATSLKGFTVALVGGLDSIEGVVPAALLVATLEVVTVRWVDQQWSEAVPFAILLVVLMIRPWGLFGRTEELERV
jgi:branched-chain amino acid transport system permease protein